MNKQPQVLPKGDLINKVMTLNNSVAGNKKADADMFFSLAFMNDKDLVKMCKKLNIKTTA